MIKFPCSILVLLLLAQASQAFTYRNRSIPFSSFDSRRRLVSASSQLFFVKTEDVSIVDYPGFHGILERTIYLVDSSVFDRASVSEVADYYPEYKYWQRDENLTDFIVRVVKGGSFQHPNCSSGSPYHPFEVYQVKCENGTSLKDLASMWNTISFEPLPTIHLNSPARRSSSNSSVLFVPASISLFPATLIVSDTGLDLSHCAFYSAPRTPVIESIPGLTTTGGCIEGAHGTATAAIACGLECIPGIKGQAPGAPLVFGDLAALGQSSNEENLVVSADMFSAFFLGAYSVQTHSASWGFVGDNGEMTDFSSMFDQFVYDHPTLVHVFAVGNGGIGTPGTPPSTGKNVLSVGALDASGNIASFTSNGILADGRTSPLLYAVGQDVLVAYAFRYPPGSPNHIDYTQGSGTSFSAPNISGIIIREQSLRWPTLTHASLIHAILFAQRDKLWLGYKRMVELRNFTYDLVDGMMVSGQMTPYVLQITKSEPAIISLGLAWIEHSVMPYSTCSLLNNLDAYLIGEDDAIWKGIDALHTNEVMDNRIWYSDTMFLIVFSRDPSIIANVSFGLHMISSAPLEFTLLNASSICFPGDIIQCANGTGVRQCQTTNLTFEAVCSNCDLGSSPVFDSNGTSTGSCACDPTIYINSSDPYTLCGLSQPNTIDRQLSRAQNTHFNYALLIVISLSYLFVI